MIPKAPSEPIIRRSGLGPAPEPGRRRLLQRAGGRHRAQALHELVDVGVERRIVAAGAGGDPAAEGREFEGLREVPQREPRRLELGLQRRPEDAALNAGRARGAVDLQHLVQAAEVDGQGAGVGVADGGLDAAHHGGACAVGNRREPSVARPVEQRHDVRFGLGTGHHVGRRAEVAGPGADVIGVGLAVGVARAAVGIAAAERGERVRRPRAGRRQVQLVEGGRRPVGAGFEPGERCHAPGDAPRIGLAQCFGFEAPTPELAPCPGHRRSAPVASARRGCSAPR